MPSANIRERIIDYIDHHRSASAPEMAEALGVTRANIRHHLAALQVDGIIEISPNSNPQARGRPMLYYHLHSEARPNNLTNLIHALLSIHENEAQKDADAQAILRRIAAFMLQADMPQGNLTHRLSTLVRLLNRWNYQARWEAHSQAPRIFFHNCPYAAVLQQHPELCKLDQYLLEHATNQAAHQTARVNLITNQPPACIFLLLSREDAASTP